MTRIENVHFAWGRGYKVTKSTDEVVRGVSIKYLICRAAKSMIKLFNKDDFNIIWRRIDSVKETLFMRQPSLDASVVVDVENNAFLAEFHMGIGMEPSFKMDL